MARFHRSDDHQEADDTVADALEDADYDAQQDLALPTHESSPDIAFNPYAGELDDQPMEPGYDIGRDIAT